MTKARFDAPTRFADAGELRTRFASERLALADGASVTFEGEVELADDVGFAGDCRIGDGCAIGAGSQLTGVTLGPRTRVRPYSILEQLVAGAGNLFGPFCFIRDGCTVGESCILGAHVEAARSRFASGVKVSHRAFIGDAEVGRDAIIGAGVVFCNWDGKGRQATRVGAGATIGSGSLLIPPLAVGDHAIVGAGSTVTRDVPAGAKIIQKRG